MSPILRWSPLLVGLALACEDTAGPAPGEEAPATGPGRERKAVLGGFLAEHWRLPVPPQGEPPSGWSEAEASLDPTTCGACHPKQLAEWQTSLHAGAWSPGFAGQLIEGSLAAPAARHHCMSCHAPLSEQRTDAALRRQGIVCASCHVRRRRTFGPPRRPDAPPPPRPVPHDGFGPRAEFLESRFCAECHQFFDDPGVAGKPVENTFFEWRASPFAAEGRQCQECHMPDRAHLWRGIHDPEMVRSGVEAELVSEGAGLEGAPLEAALVVHNRGVGHAFPTYVTPRVFLAVWQEDADGRELPDTREEATIARILDFARQPWRELSDTRVMPGRSRELAYRRPRAEGAAVLAGRVTVDPDHHYRGVFASLLESYRDPEARRLIGEAHRRSLESSYVLYELRRPL